MEKFICVLKLEKILQSPNLPLDVANFRRIVNPDTKRKRKYFETPLSKLAAATKNYKRES